MPIDPTPFRDPPLYTLSDLAERAGVDLVFARRLFRALGFPDVADDLVDFSERDLDIVWTRGPGREGDRRRRDVRRVFTFAYGLAYGPNMARNASAEQMFDSPGKEKGPGDQGL